MHHEQRSGRDQGGRFRKGHSGNPAGRRPGSNRVTTEAKAACNAIVDDWIYRSNLLTRMRKGTAAPAVETMVWYYAKGKPKERVELGADKTLADLVREAIEGSPAPEPEEETPS